MTGQNIGAGKQDRAAEANHFGSGVMFVVLTALGGVAWLAATPIAAIFTTDQAVVEASATFLRYDCGDVRIHRRPPGVQRRVPRRWQDADRGSHLDPAVRLPVAWFGANAYGAGGLWVAFAVSNVVAGVVAYLWFRRDTWRDADLTGGRRGSAPLSEPTTDD